MPPPFPMTSNSWPFFIPNQQFQSISPVVLLPQQAVPTSVNSDEVNNLIMISQQRPQSLMTSDELNRRVDDQIKQHWFLLGDRQPPPTPRPVSAALPPSHSQHQQHHHHHSHSTNSSPNPYSTRKKNVCFNDSSSVRRYSVDDLNMSRESPLLKSCLKSSTGSSIPTDQRPPTDVFHHTHTQTAPTCHKPRPDSATMSSSICRSPSVPSSIEHWHNRQLKSAPGKSRI